MLFLNIPLLPVLIASITTFAVISLIRPFAIRIKLVDKPSSRKLHTGSIPLIGGIAMYIGVVASILVTSDDLNQFNFLFLSSFILLVIGVLDDRQNIAVSLRLFLQVIVAMIVVFGGDISIGSFGKIFGNDEILINEWTYFISIIAIITGMNAINMSDGLHGLAGGSSLVTFFAILYLSIDNTSQEDILIALLCCSVLLVFLIYNLCLGMSEHKRIFMGDSGSMVIGLLIVWLLINLSQGEDRAFSPVTALWLFALPLIEISAVTLRRLASGVSPFKPDRNHAHHLLIRLGFEEKSTLLILILFSLLTAIIVFLGEQYS